jgi:hypothetical protein
MDTARDIWKVRVVKPYPEAHNHLLIGHVVERDATCLKMRCRSFHFGRVVGAPRDVTVGPLARRIIPWARVEIINELPASFDYQNARLSKGNQGEVTLSDGRTSCVLARSGDRSY